MNKEACAFRQSIEIQENNNVQKSRIYQNYVNGQITNFEDYIEYINEILCILKDYRIVSEFTQFSARVKSVDSAIKNDEIKALNDTFGLEIDFATPGEKIFVLELLRETLNKTKESVHVKDNGYIASHYSGYPSIHPRIVEGLEKILKNDLSCDDMFNEYYNSLSTIKKQEIKDGNDQKIIKYFSENEQLLKEFISLNMSRIDKKRLKNLETKLQLLEKDYINKIIQKCSGKKDEYANFPIIECQFKTIQVAIESALGINGHNAYKGINMEDIQKYYDMFGELPLSSLPVMYFSRLERDKNGNIIKPYILSQEETLKRLYPLIITNTEKKGVICLNE